MSFYVNKGSTLKGGFFLEGPLDTLEDAKNVILRDAKKNNDFLVATYMVFEKTNLYSITGDQKLYANQLNDMHLAPIYKMVKMYHTQKNSTVELTDAT